MRPRIVVGVVFMGLAFMESFSPGWTGIFQDPLTVSADAQRITTAIYSVGAALLIFGGQSS